MKKAKNFSLKGNMKMDLADKIIAKYDAGETISCAEMQELCGTKYGNKEERYVLIEGNVYYLKLNSVGNLQEIWLFATTKDKKAEEIKKHEDKEILTTSDAGGYLINGLLFANGYGDGVNTVIIRKFLEDPKGSPTSRAEVYNQECCITVACPTGVKVWGTDCADVRTEKPAIDEPNAFKICVCGRKLYVFVRGW